MNYFTYLFPNFKGAAIEVWEWLGNFTHTSLDMWLFIHAGIKVKPRYQKGVGVGVGGGEGLGGGVWYLPNYNLEYSDQNNTSNETCIR